MGGGRDGGITARASDRAQSPFAKEDSLYKVLCIYSINSIAGVHTMEDIVVI